MLTDLLAALAEPCPRTRDQVGPAVLDRFLGMSVTDQLREIERDLGRLPTDSLQGIVRALGATLRAPFIPLPGPQSAALNSAADELLYGGAAGGGKSALLVGCAALNHKRALILRRQSNELDGLIAELHEMLGRDGWRSEGSGGTHTAPSRVIRLGGCREPEDWKGYAGRARDYIGFDEAAEFLEEQVASLIGWLRSTDPKQRCRVILASNPPRGAEGQWIIEWFAPWLDPTYPNLAQPGELRWFIVVKSKTRWVDGPGVFEIDGEAYTARSRTFIPALLDDNAFLARTDYRAVLQGMREPLRSQLLKGDFLAGREDDAWQAIPSDWVLAARRRWSANPPTGAKMTAMGVDVAQGGADRTTRAARYGSWFAPVKTTPGADTPDGISVASLVFAEMRDGCGIVIDVGGGWGAEAFGHLRKHLDDEKAVAFLGVKDSTVLTIQGTEGFTNKRAEAWWRFREALDPEMGAGIALPPDPELAAELAMPRCIPERKQITIESKEQIKKRLGRSPDKADAVVMAWAYQLETPPLWGGPLQTRALVGYENAKTIIRRGLGQLPPSEHQTRAVTGGRRR